MGIINWKMLVTPVVVYFIHTAEVDWSVPVEILANSSVLNEFLQD